MIRSSRKSYGNVFVQMPSRPTRRSKAGDSCSLSKISSLLVTTEASSSDSSASVSSAAGVGECCCTPGFKGEVGLMADGLMVLAVATSRRRPSSSWGRMNKRDDNRKENMYSWRAFRALAGRGGGGREEKVFSLKKLLF